MANFVGQALYQFLIEWDAKNGWYRIGKESQGNWRLDNIENGNKQFCHFPSIEEMFKEEIAGDGVAIVRFNDNGDYRGTIPYNLGRVVFSRFGEKPFLKLFFVHEEQLSALEKELT